jgi:signal peptidase II
MTHRRPLWPWFTGVAGLLILDQVTKALVRSRLPLHHSISVFGNDFLRLTHVQNPGVVFGYDFIGRWPLVVFGWAAAVVLAIFLTRLVRRDELLKWPVVLLIAGAIGNSIDRTIFGKVTDFVDVDLPDVIMERFAVFNVADSCMTVGIIMLLIIVLFTSGRHSHSAAEAHVESSPSTTPPADHRTGTTTAAD